MQTENLKAIKKVRVELIHIPAEESYFSVPHWRLRVSVVPYDGDTVNAERILDETRFGLAIRPELVLDYTLGVMRDTILSIIKTGKVKER